MKTSGKSEVYIGESSSYTDNPKKNTSATSSSRSSITSRRYVRRLCLATLGARRRALTQTIGNARGLDINSPRSAEIHTQDLRFRRHQQYGDHDNDRGLDNNFASDRGCDSTTSTRRPLRPRL
jgi:hypothetical protein